MMGLAFLRKESLVIIGLAVVMSVGLNKGVDFFWPQNPAKTIATVQLTDVVKTFVVSLAKRKDLTPKQTQQKIATFQQTLQSKLEGLAKRYNLILLSKSAVLSKVPDLTPVIKNMNLK